MDNFDKLERLHNLLKKGIITEEDFLIQKEKLLNDNLDVKEIIPEETKILPINPSENSNYIPKTTVIPTIQETAINQPENSNNSLEKEEEEIEEKSFLEF